MEEIHVKSEPGQRTTFTVCLRKGKAHFEDSDLMETSVSHQAYEASRLDDSETKEILSKTYPYTILITEDDDEVRGFLERELSLHFKIRTAANGKDALRVLEEGGDIIGSKRCDDAGDEWFRTLPDDQVATSL